MNIQKKQRRTVLCRAGRKPDSRPLSPRRLCVLGMTALLFSATGYGQISRDVTPASGTAPAASSESPRAQNAEERLAALEKELADLRGALSAPVREKKGKDGEVAETRPVPAISEAAPAGKPPVEDDKAGDEAVSVTPPQSTAPVVSAAPVSVDGAVPKTTDAGGAPFTQITPENTPAVPEPSGQPSSAPAPKTELPVRAGTPAPVDGGAQTVPLVRDDKPQGKPDATVEAAPAVVSPAVKAPEVTGGPAKEPAIPEPPAVTPAAVPVSAPEKSTPAGTPSLLTPPSGMAPAIPAGKPEAAAPRTLSEQEQNSYVVGMMVADYARSVLGTLDKLDVRPDEQLFREGLQDTLSGKAVLDGPVAQAAMQRIQKSADARQAERDAEARKELATIAGGHTVLEKKEDRVWVRLQKGGPAVSKQTPLLLSWEGQFYNGAVFETVTDAEVTRREVLPAWLQRAIRLAGPGGEVRLFILAGSLEGEAPLPAGTGRHELVQYTVSVKKAK